MERGNILNTDRAVYSKCQLGKKIVDQPFSVSYSSGAVVKTLFLRVLYGIEKHLGSVISLAIWFKKEL